MSVGAARNTVSADRALPALGGLTYAAPVEEDGLSRRFQNVEPGPTFPGLLQLSPSRQNPGPVLFVGAPLRHRDISDPLSEGNVARLQRGFANRRGTREQPRCQFCRQVAYH